MIEKIFQKIMERKQFKFRSYSTYDLLWYVLWNNYFRCKLIWNITTNVSLNRYRIWISDLHAIKHTV